MNINKLFTKIESLNNIIQFLELIRSKLKKYMFKLKKVLRARKRLEVVTNIVRIFSTKFTL